jgi:hypothetical protein
VKKAPKGGGKNASQLITDLIAELGDWRGEVLARLRKLILDAAPALTEEWTWGGQQCGPATAWSVAPVRSRTT